MNEKNRGRKHSSLSIALKPGAMRDSYIHFFFVARPPTHDACFLFLRLCRDDFLCRFCTTLNFYAASSFKLINLRTKSHAGFSFFHASLAQTLLLGHGRHECSDPKTCFFSNMQPRSHNTPAYGTRKRQFPS